MIHRFALVYAALVSALPLCAQNLLQVQPLDVHSIPVLGTYVNNIAAGDVDGDGDDDLAACEVNDAAVYHQQNGQFMRHLVLSDVQTAPTMVAVADFDNDGFGDVLFGPYGSITQSRLRIWWGNGTGQFATAPTTDITIPSDFRGGRVATSDVDHDGDIDVVVSKAPGALLHTCILERNLGNRTFAEAPQAQFPLLDAGDCTAFCIDVDGDTYDEVVLVSRTARSRLYWNNGGNFVEATSLQFPVLQRSLRGLALADFDGDTDLDLVFGGDLDTGVLVRCIGPRQFTLAPATTLPERTVALHAGDANGDGTSDLHVFRSERGQLFGNDGTGNFALATTFGACDETQVVVRADLDDDGDVDLLRIGNGRIYQTPQPASRIAVSFTVQDGRLEHLGGQNLPPSTQSGSRALGDIDGDGQQDLLLTVNEPSISSPSYLQVATNDGRGAYAHHRAQRLGLVDRGFFADLDGDGRDELVVPGIATAYFANTNGVLATVATPLPVAGLIANGAAFDLDGDSDSDLAFLEQYGPLARLRILVNVGGAWQDQTASRLSSPAVPYSTSSSLRIVAADLDGDLDRDLSVGSDSYQMILRNVGGFLTYVPGAMPGSTLGYRTTAADLDRDGDLDLHVGRGVFLNDGSGLFTDVSQRVPNVFGHESLGAVADVDDDGDLDLVGDGLVMWNDGHAFFSLASNISPVQYGNGAALAWTDADRDGDPDLLAITGFDSKVTFFTNLLRQLWLTGPARIGGTIDFRYQARPGQTAQPILVWLMCSFARTAPTQLGSFGFVQIDTTMAIPIGYFALPPQGGSVQHSENVPADPALRGVFFCAQPVELRGGRWRIGNLVQTWLGR